MPQHDPPGLQEWVFNPAFVPIAITALLITFLALFARVRPASRELSTLSSRHSARDHAHYWPASATIRVSSRAGWAVLSAYH